jgi:hypothetical protein
MGEGVLLYDVFCLSNNMRSTGFWGDGVAEVAQNLVVEIRPLMLANQQTEQAGLQW